MYDNYDRDYDRNKEKEDEKREAEEKEKEKQEAELKSKLKKEEVNFDVIKRVQEEAYHLNESLHSNINAAAASLMNLPVNRRQSGSVVSHNSAPTVTLPSTSTVTSPETKPIPSVSAVLPVQNNMTQQQVPSTIPRL